MGQEGVEGNATAQAPTLLRDCEWAKALVAAGLQVFLVTGPELPYQASRQVHF